MPQTQKVSIEDYEEVKDVGESLWIGEIPVTENIETRQEWVDQDVVRISNILNNLYLQTKSYKSKDSQKLAIFCLSLWWTIWLERNYSYT